MGSLQYNAAELHFFGVSEGHRRKGIGTAMLNKFINRGKSKGVEKFYTPVQTDNEAATKLYEKFGFEKGCMVFYMFKDWSSAE
jgi:ribosomal-protein-alanine N-acetyltransferase